MSKQSGTKETAEPTSTEPPSSPPILTADEIKIMMRAAAKGAAELDNKMKPLFQLSDRSASLRFK